MVMKSVLCKARATAEEHVKHIPQYGLSTEHIILVMFTMKYKLKPKNTSTLVGIIHLQYNDTIAITLVH
jgi:hypothetical protein